eukprot:gene3749-4668_t
MKDQVTDLEGLVNSAHYQQTQQYLRVQGGTYKGVTSFEKAPQFPYLFRQQGFFMDSVRKVSLFRDGKIECVGPHQVIPVDGQKLEVPKYYSNWEIDYPAFVASISSN